MVCSSVICCMRQSADLQLAVTVAVSGTDALLRTSGRVVLFSANSSVMLQWCALAVHALYVWRLGATKK